MPSSKDYMEMDDKYCAHNYHPIPVVISKAEGVWVYDPEGKKYIDGFVDTKEKFYTRFEAAEQLGLPKSTFLRSEDLPFFES